MGAAWWRAITDLAASTCHFAVLQLLWVNLIMDTMGALALATEDPNPDLLNDKVRPGLFFGVSTPYMAGLLVQHSCSCLAAMQAVAALCELPRRRLRHFVPCSLVSPPAVGCV